MPESQDNSVNTDDMTSRASLLVMAKEPKPGSAKTRLIPSLSAERAADLARCFLLDSIDLGHKAATEVDNLTVKIACSPAESEPYFRQLLDDVDVVPQAGETLGHRLDHVIDHELTAGYQLVAAINSDGPSLPVSSLVAAYQTLKRPEVDIVLGPTEDGGYYLIGMKQRWPEITIDVEMSTPTVLADTLAVAESLGARVELLPTWFDIDEPQDLDRLRRDIDAGVGCGQHTINFFAANEEETTCVSEVRSTTGITSSTTAARRVSVAVIAPALNEAGNIGTVVSKVLQPPADAQRKETGGGTTTPNVELAVTMIVVDNGSNDDTPTQARNAGAVVVNEDRRGYGYACKAGAEHAIDQGAQIIAFIDGDQSSRPEELDKLLQPLLNGSADLVLGSRTKGTIDKGAMAPHQRFGNWLTSRLMRSIYKIEVTDLGPYRALTSDLYQQLAMSEMTFGWPTEMMVKAAKLNARVMEVPVTWLNRAEGKSKVSGTVKGSVLSGWHIVKVTLRFARR